MGGPDVRGNRSEGYPLIMCECSSECNWDGYLVRLVVDGKKRPVEFTDGVPRVGERVALKDDRVLRVVDVLWDTTMRWSAQVTLE